MKENREKKEKTRIKHIFSIYRRDLYNMTHNPVAVVIMLGLLVLPSLYAWVNIVACWDPYGNTNGIKVAVVNLDRGVTLQGNTINAGDNIVESLRSNDAIGWQFVSISTFQQILHCSQPFIGLFQFGFQLIKILIHCEYCILAGKAGYQRSRL